MCNHLCNSGTVSTLCAYTSNPDRATFSIALRSPRKSGVRHSTRILGFLKEKKISIKLRRRTNITAAQNRNHPIHSVSVSTQQSLEPCPQKHEHTMSISELLNEKINPEHPIICTQTVAKTHLEAKDNQDTF